MAQQRSGSAKQQSKNQSRSVASTKRAPTKAAKRSSFSPISWIAIGLVLVVVVGLIIYAVTSGNSGSTTGGNAYEQAPAALVKQVTQIPASVYDTVGVTSSVAQVTAAHAHHGPDAAHLP